MQAACAGPVRARVPVLRQGATRSGLCAHVGRGVQPARERRTHRICEGESFSGGPRSEQASQRAVRTHAAASSAGGSGQVPGLTTKQVVYLVAWYAFNVAFNIYNKKALTTFPCPWAISTLQLFAGNVIMLVLWGTNIVRAPRISKEFVKALVPACVFHLIGHVSACTAFGAMALSFAHVIKAAEPVLSVILSGPLLGVTYGAGVWLSLVPIVAGCSLAAMKEVSFAWGGFSNAMISNVGMVLRNIYSKKSLGGHKEISGINLYACISMLGFVLLAPVAYLVEGAKWPAAWDAAVAGIGQEGILFYLVVSGLLYHGYNQSSYMVLDTGVSAVTFSIANALKRVAVVVSAVIVFQNPMNPLNATGSALALLGAYLYSVATQKEKDAKAAAEAAKSA
ncbi:unnamed protein product [Pedinophyceae sp. YPF-701]|nr:unnamed protein product [Pedinophyceae sp. YPF-701]